MADPATIAMVAGIASTAGTAVQTVGAYQQAKGQQSIAKRDAVLARREGDMQAQQKLREGRLLRSAQAAGYAGAGVDLTGSALDVMKQSASEITRDALALRYGGQVRAQGLREEASGLGSQAVGQLIGGTLSTAGTAYKGYRDWKAVK